MELKRVSGRWGVRRVAQVNRFEPLLLPAESTPDNLRWLHLITVSSKPQLSPIFADQKRS